jgi:DNA-binding transcriptional ArsR family regulator
MGTTTTKPNRRQSNADKLSRATVGGSAVVVFWAVLVGVRMLVVGVLWVFGMLMLVDVMLGDPGRIVMSVAVLVGVRMLMAYVFGVVGVAVFVHGVLGSCFGHNYSSDRDGDGLQKAHVCDYIRMYVDSDTGAVDDDQVLLAVEMFRLLADATRVRLLRALSAGPGELSVNELSERVGKRPGAVSQHLAKLRMARLVTTRREGNQIMYRVANEHVSQLLADALRHGEHLGSGIPAHHLSS